MRYICDKIYSAQRRLTEDGERVKLFADEGTKHHLFIRDGPMKQWRARSERFPTRLVFFLVLRKCLMCFVDDLTASGATNLGRSISMNESEFDKGFGDEPIA